ncbi:MAG: hypothetical protein RJQ04_11015 [Longimicrobiales bacterium]
MRTGAAAVAVVWALLCAPPGTGAQAPPPLFGSTEPLEVTLSADFSLLKQDRRGETPERPATVTLTAPDGTPVVIEAQVRTRGRTRRSESVCSMPPLRLNLKTKQTEGTVFEGQDKLKLVGSCRPGLDTYEQLVLAEYVAYQAFRTVTEVSFRVRLARITYVDDSGQDAPSTRFAFFIEDDDALAERVGATVFELPEGSNLPAAALEPVSATAAAVFQYMIGNTDWSDIAGHNVELLQRGGSAIPVPYDFDYSGLVDAPYAVPHADLRLPDVRTRMYRGFCQDEALSRVVVARFLAARPEILGQVAVEGLDESVRRRITAYLEDFFQQIETPERARNRFLRDCRTG